MYFLSYQISRQSDWNYPELLLRFCFPITQNFRIAIMFKKIMRFFLPNFWEPPKLFLGSLPKWFFGSLPKFSVLPKCCRLPKFGSLPAFWSLLKLLNVMIWKPPKKIVWKDFDSGSLGDLVLLGASQKD